MPDPVLRIAELWTDELIAKLKEPPSDEIRKTIVAKYAVHIRRERRRRLRRMRLRTPRGSKR